jgi:tetratricopeptide (TPR) repeat protein
LKSTVRNTKSSASAACLAMLFFLAAGCQTAPKPKADSGTLQGIVFDLDKTPVSGALIELQGPGGKVSAITDSQGRFSIPGIAAGECELSFSKPMYERKSWQVALSDFSEAVYLQAAGYWQLLDAALSSLGNKELGEAEDFLRRAKSIQEKSSTSLFLEGVLAERRGDYAAAIGDLEAAAALDPRSPYLWLYLADLYERSGSGAMKEAEALGRYLELRDDPAAEERKTALMQ